MKKLECLKCGHTWWPRNWTEGGQAILPKVCPICKRTSWAEPKKGGKGK